MAPRSRRTLLGRTPQTGRTPPPARRTSSPGRASIGLEGPPAEDEEILAAEEADEDLLAALEADLDATLDREPEAHLALAAPTRGRPALPPGRDDFEDALHVEEVFSARHWENDDRADSGVMDEVSESGWRGRSAFAEPARSAFAEPQRFDDPTVKVGGAGLASLPALAFVSAEDEREATIGRHLERISDDDALEKTERLPQRRANPAASAPSPSPAADGPASRARAAAPKPAEDRAWVVWLVGSSSAVALGLAVAAALVGVGVASVIWPVERTVAPADEVVAPATPGDAAPPAEPIPVEPVVGEPVAEEPAEPPAAAPKPRPRKPATAPVAAPEPPPPIEAVAPEPAPPPPAPVVEEEEESKKKRKKKDR